MKQYLEILDRCLNNPFYDWEINKRTGKRTIGVLGAVLQHDMNDGFPLVTTKRMAVKSIFAELEMFIKGRTDKKFLWDRNCKIWNGWANPVKVQEKYDLAPCQTVGLKEKIAEEEPDLGPIYGYQWRNFDGPYDFNIANSDNPVYTIDQVSDVIAKLKSDPSDRRMVVSAWNPKQVREMALPPCLVLHHIIVKGGKLSLNMYQRSCDMFLGVPFDLASNAMLLLLYAKEGGFKPGYLSMFLADAHIYEDHVSQVREQLSRKPHPLPAMEIPDENWNGMLNWGYTDFNLKDYVCHDAIKAEVSR